MTGSGARRPAEPEPTAENRRSHQRVKVAAVAALPGEPQVWVVRDLSQGGASMAGGPPLTPGSRHMLAFHVHDRAPFLVSARVLRRQVNAPAGQFAVAFEKVSAEQGAAIAEAVAAGARAPAPDAAAVVVVAPPSRARTILVRELRGAGCEPQVVASALSGAALLQAHLGGAVLLVDDKMIEVDGWNLAQFVQDCQPHVRRLAIASKVHSFRLNLALRAGLVDAVIEPPFRAASLAAKLGFAPPAA